MSYILDALKKADSERQHGKTPDIYSRQPHNDTLEKEESIWSKPIVWFLLVVLVVLILIAGLFFNSWYRMSPVAILPRAQVAPAPIASAAPIAPAVQSAPAAPIPVAEPVSAASTTPLTTPIAAVENPAPVAAAPAEPVKLQPSPKLSIPAATDKHEKHKKRHASASSKAPKTPATKESDLAIETVSTTLRDLPLNIQNAIPTVTVGGYIYSANRAECQLLINKLLLHEGEKVAPGLILERMMPHSAILNYKGYRYRISY